MRAQLIGLSDRVYTKNLDLISNYHSVLWIRHLPSRKSDDQVHHHQQDTLEPVGLAVTNEVVHLHNQLV